MTLRSRDRLSLFAPVSSESRVRLGCPPTRTRRPACGLSRVQHRDRDTGSLRLQVTVACQPETGCHSVPVDNLNQSLSECQPRPGCQ
eukprot:2039732-Rhodomonas_salina.1